MRYVALLRGIMPQNPNMRNEKLRAVFEELGLMNVQTVIASGNVVFDSPSKSRVALEKKIEEALLERLEISITVIVRSRNELEALIKRNPFKNVKDERPNYLVVTFFKDSRPEACATIDTAIMDGTAFMRELERKHGKKITTRTWKTVHRMVKKT